MMDWEQVSKELQQPLNPDAIKPPPQGKYGEYVEALHCIREANRIFGHDGWSYDTKQLTCTTDQKNGDKHFVGYFALVEVFVDGVRRTDVGHGSGVSKNHGDAHDSAVKEAVTDALKRALRTFGNTFGLALYEKDPAKREVGRPEPTDADKRDWVIQQITQAPSKERLSEWWKGKADFINALPQPMQNQLATAYAKRESEFGEAA